MISSMSGLGRGDATIARSARSHDRYYIYPVSGELATSELDDVRTIERFR